MAQGQFSEVEKSDALRTLYLNLREPDALTPLFTFERFLSWVGQYLRPSREFHSINHLLSMSELPPDLPRRAAVYSMISGFFHDEDYPSISEGLTQVSQRFINKYVEEAGDKKFLRQIEPEDEVGQMLQGIFGFTPAQELLASPKFADGKCLNPGGMNEFYSAAAAAGELAELGKDKKFLAAIITGIEGTIPFRGPERMNELRKRLEETNARLSLGLTPPEMDEIMIGAVHTANKDVISFLGGLDPQKDTQPTRDSVRITIQGGELLSPEEVDALRLRDKARNTGPGHYTPKDFLTARIKRAGLYHLVIPGNPETQTIPNMYYKVQLSDGSHYPPGDWVEKANRLAYANNRPVRVAEFARLLSAATVYSIAAVAGKGCDPSQVQLVDLVGGLGTLVNPSLPQDASDVRKLAFECLHDRLPSGGHDITRSPLAELILSRMDENEVERLGKEARQYLFPQPDPQKFLDFITKESGELVANIREALVRATADRGQHVIATRLSAASLPQVITH